MNPIYLEDFEQDRVTPEEVKEYVLNKLVEQGTGAFDKIENSCVYRGKNGVKCAFGHLIPNEKYSANMEYRDAEEVIGMLEMDFSLDKISFLGKMQIAHDYASDVERRCKKDFKQVIVECFEKVVYDVNDHVTDGPSNKESMSLPTYSFTT